MRSLDNLLSNSAPDLGEDGEPITAALDGLVASTRTAARTASRTRGTRDRRPRHTILAASATAAVLVGGGAAAAVTTSSFGNWIAPWTADPTGTLTFALPSGGVCEQRIGDLKVANPQAEEMIHTWLADHTLAEIADIDAAIEADRAAGPETWTFDGDTGHRPDVVYGYGTANYDADYEYTNAVYQAETEAILAKLADEGYTEYEDYNYSWSSELQCSGSNAYPGLPEFAK